MIIIYYICFYLPYYRYKIVFNTLDLIYMKLKCININPSTISILLGVTKRNARIILARLKKHFQKESHQIITEDEFCNYFGIKENDSAREVLRNRK